MDVVPLQDSLNGQRSARTAGPARHSGFLLAGGVRERGELLLAQRRREARELAIRSALGAHVDV